MKVSKLPAALSNDDLARLMLRRVWQIQDAGGVSMGRSLRNVLLECALHLMPVRARLNTDIFDELLLWEFLDKAAKRVPLPPRRMRRMPPLKRVSTRTVAILVIKELHLWYEEDARQNPMEALILETDLVRGVLPLLPLPEGFKKPDAWTHGMLIEEARERYHALLKREGDKRLQKMFKQTS
jgi:hypothetical protein